jgi:hypothetical protein
MSDTKRANRLWEAAFVDYSSHLLPGKILINLLGSISTIVQKMKATRFTIFTRQVTAE